MSEDKFANVVNPFEEDKFSGVVNPFETQQPPSFDKPVENMNEVDVRATNAVYMQSLGVQPNEIEPGSMRDAYLGQQNTSEEGMYQHMAGIEKYERQPINMLDYLDRAAYKAEEGLLRGTASVFETAAEMGITGGQHLLSSADWLNDQADQRAKSASQYPETGIENLPKEMLLDAVAAPWKTMIGATAGATQILGGVENLIYDAIHGKGVAESPWTDISGRLNALEKEISDEQTRMKGELQPIHPTLAREIVSTVSQTAFDIKSSIDMMKSISGVSPWRTQKAGKTAQGFGQTIFKKTGSDLYADKAAVGAQRLIDATRFGITKGILTHGTPIERIKVAQTTTAYMATTAFSGWIDNKFLRVMTDFTANTALSSKFTYKDILESNATGREKFLSAIPTLLTDGFFSARTAPLLKEAGASPDVLRDFKMMDAMSPIKRSKASDHLSKPFESIEMLLNPIDVAKIRIYEEGKGGVRLAETEGDAKATIKATQESLTKDVIDLKQQIVELEEGQKTQPKDSKPADKEGTRDVQEKVELEIAQKEALLDVVNKNQKLTPSQQLDAINDRMKALDETVDPEVSIKTRINRVNKVRKQKPREDMTRPQFYKQMEKVSQEAAKAGIRGVGEAKASYMKFADKNFTWREVEALDTKLNKALTKEGMTVDKFTALAEREVQRLMKPRKVMERTIPIKDISSRKDISESEFIRAMLREAEKAATGAQRATIDKITMTNKDMRRVLRVIPNKLVSKMMAKKDAVIEARSDDARAKRVAEFREFSREIIEKYERVEAEGAFDKSVEKANKVLKERTTPQGLRIALSRIVDEKAPVDINEKMSIEEAETAREANLIAKSLSGISKDDMTNDELSLTSGRINALIKRSSDQQKEIDLNKRTKASQEAHDQLNSIKVEAPDFHKRVDVDKKTGKTLDKAGEMFNAATAMNLIPRGIARNLDYHREGGMFQRIQDTFTDSVIKEAYFTTRILNILDPHEAQFAKLNYKSNGDKKLIPTTTIKLGVADRLRIFLGSKDPQTLAAMIESGVSKGTGSKEGTIPMDDGKIEAIIRTMSNEEREAGEVVLRALRTSGELANERSMAEDGFKIAPNPNYSGELTRVGTDAEARHNTGDTGIKADLENGFGLSESMHQRALENSGQFKSRTRSKKPVLLYDPMRNLLKTVRVNGKYYGYAKELRDANRTLVYGRKNGLREQYHKNGRGEMYDEFESYVHGLNDLSGHHTTKSGRWASNVVSGFMEYTAGTLKINPKVQFYQIGSFPLMRSSMSSEAYQVAHKQFNKSFAGTIIPFNKNMEERIAEMSKEYPYINMRYKGRMGVAVGDQERSKKQMRGMEGIRHKDAAVIYSGLKGVEYDVAKLGLPPAEARAEIEKRMTNIIMDSQPSQDDPSRPALSRSDSDIARRLTMFMSQRNKLMSMNSEALMPLYESARRGEPLTKKEIGQAWTRLLPVIKSQMIIGGVQTIAEQIIMEIGDSTGLRERKRFDTPEEYAVYLGNELFQNTAFAGAGGWGAFASVLTSTIQGYEFEAVPVRSILTDLAATASVMNMLADYAEAKYEGDGNEWRSENGMLLGEKISRALTPATMIWKGFNAKAFYRWFVEAPTVLLDRKDAKDRLHEWQDKDDDERNPPEKRSALRRILSPEGDE